MCRSPGPPSCCKVYIWLYGEAILVYKWCKELRYIVYPRWYCYVQWIVGNGGMYCHVRIRYDSTFARNVTDACCRMFVKLDYSALNALI